MTLSLASRSSQSKARLRLIETWWPSHSYGSPVEVLANWFSGSSPSRAFQAPPEGFWEVTEMRGQVTAGSSRAAPKLTSPRGPCQSLPPRAGRRLPGTPRFNCSGLIAFHNLCSLPTSSPPAVCLSDIETDRFLPSCPFGPS